MLQVLVERIKDAVKMSRLLKWEHAEFAVDPACTSSQERIRALELRHYVLH